MLHTVDPNGSEAIVALIRRWPPELRERLCYYPMSSMEFFTIAATTAGWASWYSSTAIPGYEYALFDITAQRRWLGGFIAIDNISQGGPLYAARNFIENTSGWRECGRSLASLPQGKVFDLKRSTIDNTDLCMIRAPSRYIIGPRPETTGARETHKSKIDGIELTIARPASGTLQTQYVVRVVKPQSSETTTETSVELRDAVGPIRVALPWIFTPDDVERIRSVELWLGWSGDKELELSERPVFY